ncbi:TolC family protein [Aliikangiella sp. IMCC44359]|uniref:TolC family protein n=1 Tax=Aliikangiella sp. IMCC44359 TaxID=3459125 RepID=UPI00403ACB27
MFRCLFKRFPLGSVCLLVFSTSLCAAPADNIWGDWLQNQIDQHPEVIAAKEQMNSALSRADSQDQPLYNPELETEFEREGESKNYRIGINQTIDWWDKAGIRKQQATHSRQATRNTFELIRQQKTAETISALIEWHSANQQARLASEQEQHLETLLKAIKERQQAGDLGQLDAELTYLELSQKLNETAKALVQFKRAEAQLRELLPDWSSEWAQIPKTFWQVSSANEQSETIEDHPNIVASRAKWETLRQEAKLIRQEAKAEPSFGINAGKSGDDDVVALSFSIPLNVRNNFSAETRAADQQALAAESQYLAVRRKQQYAVEGAQAALIEYQQHYQRWQTLMKGRVESSAKLLEKQWLSGDVSTPEYLISLQQRAEGLLAGIELQTQYRMAYTDWLLQTGQINTALKQLK